MFPGKLIHTNEITVLLGENWFAQCTAYKAAEIINHRLKSKIYTIFVVFNVKTLERLQNQAPSTSIRIFLKTHLFLSVLGSRPHGDGVFSHRKRSFSKTLSRVDLFENAVFMLSYGRVKTELFENADVVSEHAHGSLGTTKGHFDCLFSFVEVRTAKFECSSVFVWTGIFSKTLLVWTRIFLKTDEKRCVFKNIRIRVDEASYKLKCSFGLPKELDLRLVNVISSLCATNCFQ